MIFCPVLLYNNRREPIVTAALELPGLGRIAPDGGMVALDAASDGVHRVGVDGVVRVLATGDRKVEFIAWARHTLALVRSQLGYPAYYPVHPVEIRRPLKAVLMDLDGTSVHSESFWMWMIELTLASVRRDPSFKLAPDDTPFVSGHSVSEHLAYGIRKYCPAGTLEDARRFYFEHVRREMAEIVAGRGRAEAFRPTPGLKPFLLALKQRGVKIGLVTSGLHEKAWPEIVAAFRTLELGDPATFYDAIITAGHLVRPGEPGTLGELSPKPHPWLYAEAAAVGLGIRFEERHHVLGIEDSGAGVCSVRLAGFACVGIDGGNIVESGTGALCAAYCRTFDEVLELVG